MPKVRRRGLPAGIVNHLTRRIREREISADQLKLLADWLDEEPDVPARKWYKRFPKMTVCGEGELVKTILRVGQLPGGEEIR
jgi:hypothetical protein